MNSPKVGSSWCPLYCLTDLESPLEAFRAERASWRAVVQLNVVRSIRLILNAISEAHGLTAASGSPVSSPLTPSDRTVKDYPPLSPELLALRFRLLPLQQVEEALLRKLAPPGYANRDATHLSTMTNLPYAVRSQHSVHEVSINSSAPWKTAFGRLILRNNDGEQDIDFDDPQDPGVVLHACAEDMVRLWNDPTIKQLLKVHGLRLEDMAGLYVGCVYFCYR